MPQGNLYIADTANNAIRVVNVQTGVIQTVAGDGNGTAGYTGDGSAATSATLNGPERGMVGQLTGTSTSPTA